MSVYLTPLIESLRVQGWEPRRKLLFFVTLAYGFLLHLLSPPLFLNLVRLLNRWQQRSDWRQWSVKLPLYRLRWALSRLWITHPPALTACWPYSPPSHITWQACSWRWWMTLWHQFGYVF